MKGLIMIQFGMPTLLENRNLEDAAKLCFELGLDFIEINMNMPQYQIDLLSYEYLKDLANRYHIYYTIHIDENFDVCNFNQRIATAWMDTLIDTIRLAKQLEIPILNMHMNKGVYITLPQEKVYLYEMHKEIQKHRFEEFKDVVKHEIANSSILITIENTDGYTEYQKECIKQLLECKDFALTLDIGHLHTSKGNDYNFYQAHMDKLVHMHIHDGKGNKNHLELGQGEIELANRLALANECNCRCVIETKTNKALHESVRWLHNRKFI